MNLVIFKEIEKELLAWSSQIFKKCSHHSPYSRKPKEYGKKLTHYLFKCLLLLSSSVPQSKCWGWLILHLVTCWVAKFNSFVDNIKMGFFNLLIVDADTDGGGGSGDAARMAADGAGRRARHAAHCAWTALHAAAYVWQCRPVLWKVCLILETRFYFFNYGLRDRVWLKIKS